MTDAADDIVELDDRSVWHASALEFVRRPVTIGERLLRGWYWLRALIEGGLT